MEKFWNLDNIISTCDSTISLERILFLLVLGYRIMTCMDSKEKKKKKREYLFEKEKEDNIWENN